MKRYTIFVMVTVFAAVMLCSCAGTENDTEVSADGSAATSATVSEAVTTSSTTTASEKSAEATSSTEPISDPEALIGEYLDYFEKNKDSILSDDTDKYRLSFFQAADRQTGMMVEISSGAESTVKRKYYGKSEKRTEEFSWGYQPSAHSDEAREYSTWLMYDAEGAYYERTLCEITYADGSGENIESILKEGEEQGAIGNTRFTYYADTIDNLVKLFETKFGAAEYRENEPPIDWSKSYNKDTERYEFYVLSVNIIKVDGEVEVLNNPIWFPILYSRVSKDDFNSAWDKYTADLTDVTDTVKYSSEWMGADDEVNKAEIIKDACGALSAERATATTSEAIETTATQGTLSASGTEAGVMIICGEKVAPDAEHLYLSDKKVTPSDIEKICSLTQLEVLDLSNDSITDIAFLRRLPRLKKLLLGSNLIEDISVLGELPRLHELDVSNNPVSGTLPFEKLTQLDKLTISNTCINDISALANKRGLNRLYMSGCPVEDISALSTAKQLFILDISNTKVRSVKALSTLEMLNALNISDTDIKDITPLSKLSLAELTLENTAVSDASVLYDDIYLNIYGLPEQAETDMHKVRADMEKEYGKLEKITICGNEYAVTDSVISVCIDKDTDISKLGLERFTNLRTLSFRKDLIGGPTLNISGLAVLSELNELKYLAIDGLGVSYEDCCTIKNIDSLRSLNIGCVNDDMSWLSELTQLESLDISGGISMDVIASLENLKSLNLLCSFQSDLSGIAKLKNLETISITDGRFSDYRALCELDKLECVYIDGKMSDEEYEYLTDYFIDNGIYYNIAYSNE